MKKKKKNSRELSSSFIFQRPPLALHQALPSTPTLMIMIKVLSLRFKIKKKREKKREK